MKGFKPWGVVLVIAMILNSFAGAAQNKKKNIVAVDSVITNPVSLDVIVNCNYGINLIRFQLPDSNSFDTSLSIKKIYLYQTNVERDPLDSIADTAWLKKVYTQSQLKETDYTYFPETEGEYYIKCSINKGEVTYSTTLSNKVSVSYCSAISFKNSFKKEKDKKYTPEKLINIQVVEFIIFDRVGETAYIHTNNDISWNGTYPNGQACPLGAYYYHCKYIDVSDNSKTKELSGIIELEN